MTTGLDLSEFDTIIHKLDVHALRLKIVAERAEDDIQGRKDNEELSIYAKNTARKAKINHSIAEEILAHLRKAHANLIAQNSDIIKSKSPVSRRKRPRKP